MSGSKKKKKLVHIHNGKLPSRKKEGTPTFLDSMDGTGGYYAKWNQPVSKRQIPYDLTYKRNLMNKIMYKIELQVWKHGTDWKWLEEEDNRGKKRKGQRTCKNDPWTWKTVWELTVGVGDGMAEEGKDPHLIRCSDYVRQLLMLLWPFGISDLTSFIDVITPDRAAYQ